MKIIRESSEDEMISEFLKAELSSDRFRQELLDTLNRHGAETSLITDANLTDNKENKLRKQILSEYRDYGRDKGLFEDFPDNVRWYSATLDADELSQIRYINFSYWLELSSGTRLAKDAAKNILDGKKSFEESNERFFAAADVIQKGAKLPRMIVVSDKIGSSIVVLEGHLRLTAYMLVPDCIPKETEIILGVSKDIINWGLF